MSKRIKKKVPAEFVPVKDSQESRNLLRQGVKNFSTSVIWTKDQNQMVYSHLASYIEGGKHAALYCWVPQDFSEEAFQKELDENGDGRCYFSVYLTTANVFFETKYLDVDPSEGIRFEIPTNIYKVQRRKDLRLPIPDGYLIKVEFTDPFEPSVKIEKKLFDISAGGLSFTVDHAEEALFQEGQILRGLSFRVRGRNIITEGEIRYLKPLLFHARLRGVKIGVQFLRISRTDYEFIKTYVLEESRKYFSKFF